MQAWMQKLDAFYRICASEACCDLQRSCASRFSAADRCISHSTRTAAYIPRRPGEQGLMTASQRPDTLCASGLNPCTQWRRWHRTHRESPDSRRMDGADWHIMLVCLQPNLRIEIRKIYMLHKLHVLCAAQNLAGHLLNGTHTDNDRWPGICCHAEKTGGCYPG